MALVRGSERQRGVFVAVVGGVAGNLSYAALGLGTARLARMMRCSVRPSRPPCGRAHPSLTYASCTCLNPNGSLIHTFIYAFAPVFIFT